MFSKFIDLIDDGLVVEKSFPATIIDNLEYVPSVLDLLRGRTDRVWSTFDEKPSKFHFNPASRLPIIFESFEDVQKAEGFFGKWTQRFKIVPKKVFFGVHPIGQGLAATIYNPQAWKAFIFGGPLLQVPDGPAQRPLNPQNNSPVATTDTQRNARQQANPDLLLGQNPNRPRTTISQTEQQQQPSTRGPIVGSGVQTQTGIQQRQDREQTFDFVPTLNTNRDFFDHATQIVSHFTDKELKKRSISGGVATINIKPTYNFFVEEFENAIADEGIPEQVLPNIYSFVLEKDTLDILDSIHHQLITLGGKLDRAFVDVFNQSGEKITDESKGEYYEDFSLNVDQLDAGKKDLFVRRFSKQVFIKTDDKSAYAKSLEKKLMFPMFFQIRFETDRTTELAQILKDLSMDGVLINDLISGNIPKREISFQKSSRILSKDGQEVIHQTNALNCWDLGQWVKNLTSNIFSSANEDAIFYADDGNPLFSQNQQFRFFKNLVSVILSGKVKELVKNRVRSFEDLLDGELAPSETLIYKITKIDPSTNAVLQETFFANSNDLNVVEFIDTQVKYNKKYKFIISAFQLVIGNKYQYLLEELNDENAFLNVSNEPDLLLVEIPIFEQETRIVDNPPIHPFIDFVPFRNVGNQIKIVLNGNVDSFKAIPVIILPEDEVIFDNVRQAQMLEKDEMIFFKEDDVPAEFEIFRLHFHPKKWSDFAGSKKIVLKTDVDLKTDLKASSGAFIDNIFPNRKYFYTFRTKDNHGHLSNPSSIFQVEIIDDAGSIYPIIKAVNFLEPQKETMKPMRRFIFLSPALQQSVVNEEKSGMVDENGERLRSIVGHRNVHLGKVEESVWNKNFKVRIISKHTGRKMDLNILFKNTFRR